MGSNITGLSDIVGDGKPSAIFYLLAYRIAYLMSGNAEEVLSKRTVRICRKLNKLIKLVGPLFLERKQVFLVDELIAICRENIPTYMIPAEYRFVEELPHTPVGKIDLKYYSEEAINAPLPECTVYELLWNNNKDPLGEIELNYYGRRFTYGMQFTNHKLQHRKLV